MVCSVVVVVAGLAGRTVVSSIVVEVVVVRGSSEAQPESAPKAEASRQGSKNFFMIMVVVLSAGFNRMARMLVFVMLVTHVLAVRGHRGCRCF